MYAAVEVTSEPALSNAELYQKLQNICDEIMYEVKRLKVFYAGF